MKSVPDAVRVVAGGAIALFAATVLFAQDPPEPARIRGDWNIAYVDEAFGVVTGTARIDSTESDARVTLYHPLLGDEYPLVSRSIERDGDAITIELEGESPTLLSERGDDYPEEALPVSRRAATLTLRSGEDETRVEIEPPPATDTDLVTLRLRLDDAGNLVGTWEYRVDPFLELDQRGHGRAGAIRDAPGGGWIARGAETWSRKKPIIYGTIPFEDQLGLFELTDGSTVSFADGSPMLQNPYPFHRKDARGSRGRTLFVFGRDLPANPYDPVEIEAETPGIQYRVSGFMDEFEPGIWNPRRGFREFNRDERSARIAEVKEKLKGLLPEAQRSELEELDWIMVDAGFDETTVPGYHAFRLNGAPAGWLLQFGDNTAEIRIVRWHRPPLHPDDALSVPWEETAYLFEGERIWIEVLTAQQLPLAEIRLLLGRNGEWARDESGRLLAAYPTPANPRLYRTGPIALDPKMERGRFRLAAQGAHSFGAGAGDLVAAMVADPGVISIEPDPTMATLFRTPKDLQRVHRSEADFVAPGSPSEGIAPILPADETRWAWRGTWENYLAAAARCHAIGDFAEDTAALPDLTRWTLNTGRSKIAHPGWFAAKVKLGHHAAMLVLRDQFVEMMEATIAFYDGLEDDQDLQRFRDAIEADVRAGNHPLTRLRFERDGVEIPFAETFDDWNSSDSTVRGNPPERREALRATREIIAAHRRNMERVITEARLAQCRAGELLALTGRHFGPVVAQARTKLMMRTSPEELAAGKGYWKPHHRARAWLENVEILAEEVEVWENVAEANNLEAQFWIGVASTAVGVGAWPAGAIITRIAPGASSQVASWAGAVKSATDLLDIADIGVGAYSLIDDYERRGDRYDFALATAEVLGLPALEAAEKERVSFVEFATRFGLEIGTALVLQRMDATELIAEAGEVLRQWKGWLAARAMALWKRARDLKLVQRYVRGGGSSLPPAPAPGSASAATRTAIEPIPEDLELTPVESAHRYLPIDEDAIATTPRRSPTGDPTAPESAVREITNEPLREGAARGSQVTVRLDDGTDLPVEIGERVGAGAFHVVYRIEGQPDKVIRISLLPDDHPAARLDAAGEAAVDRLRAHLAAEGVVIPESRAGLLNAAAPSLHGRKASIVDYVDEPSARSQGDVSPEVALEQAIAYDRAMRAFNREGFVLLDAHPGNYAFREVDGRYELVLLDPGGVLPVRNRDPRTARRIQRLIDDPPLELLEQIRVDRQHDDVYYRLWYAVLTEDYLADVNIEGAFQRWPEEPVFRAEGGRADPLKHSLASYDSLDRAGMEEVYAEFRAEDAGLGPEGTRIFDPGTLNVPRVAAPTPETPIARLDDLPSAAREALGREIADASRRLVSGGFSATMKRMALERFERENGVDGVPSPAAARARLSNASRPLLEQALHRTAIRRIIGTSSRELESLLQDGDVRGEAARRVVLWEPEIEDFAAVRAAVERSAARRPMPSGPELFEGARKGGRLAEQIEEEGWRSRIEDVESEWAAFFGETSKAVRFFDDDGDSGYVSASYQPADGTVTVRGSSRKVEGTSRAPAEVLTSVEHPSSGEPLATTDFFTLQLLGEMGIGHASRPGLPLSRVRLPAVPRREAAARLAWAAETYPWLFIAREQKTEQRPAETAAVAAALGAALRDTPSVLEAERWLALLGYRVTRVTATPRERGGIVSLGALLEASGQEPAGGLPFGAAAEDAVPWVFDVVLHVGVDEPLDAEDRAALAPAASAVWRGAGVAAILAAAAVAGTIAARRRTGGKKP